MLRSPGDADSLREGVALTLKQLDAALTKAGIAEIPAAGEKFDPHRHQAMAMIADRFVQTRAEHWQDETDDGDPAKRTMAIANLGGATLDNEENYLIKKLMSALGVVQVENQARI